jgi:FKBP-type peptidyl-prolyl cis-trans isomerase FkpA
MRRLARVAAACSLAVTISATACTDAPATPSANVPYSQTDLVVGTGADAISGTSITVNYTGWLYDTSKADHKGLQFDTSVGKTPFSFTLGAGQVIKGWDQGVVGMKVGGTRELVIPPSLAYGSTRNGSIPPNATLLFDITLVSIP